MIKMFLFLLRKQRETFLDVLEEKLDFLEESAMLDVSKSDDYQWGQISVIFEMRKTIKELRGDKK